MSAPTEADQYGPARVSGNGTRRWLKNDRPHRLDLPAVIHADGSCEWWRDGGAHRDDGPAWMDSSDNLMWCVHDRLHREDGPAVLSPEREREGWWLNDKNVE